jgi:dimethylargininase
MVHGLTTAGLGVPDYERALAQHDAYIAALERCGLAVTVLPPEEAFPDSTFVEDTALVTQAGAIITRPGAPSRRDETVSIAAALRRHFDRLDQIVAPGTVDAGDILAVGGHYFIGISGRTEVDGAAQMTRWLAARGMSAATVPLRAMLHLKSGVACLENNNLIVAGELRDRAEWSGFNTIPVDNEEGYAVNCLWLNGTVLVAAGFPKTKAAIERLGYPTIALDMSEFHKLDGGLSCLSLRF